MSGQNFPSQQRYEPVTKDSFHTVQFRAVWAAIEAEVEQIKEETVNWAHSHEAFLQRIGTVAGLRRAAELLRETEKRLMGDES